MNPLSCFRFPAYVYRPKQMLIRLRRQFQTPGESEEVVLPWGHAFSVNPGEFIGRAIWTQGIFELNVCEVIARLVGEGDTVVDVGANIGFMTSLMARAVGKTGHVLAFEAHPEIYSRLSANIARFSLGRSGQVAANQVALSDGEGEDWMVVDPQVFTRNAGTARLREADSKCGQAGFKVRLATLDSFIAGKQVVLLKIDVEGAELRVLRGAERALTEQRVKAIVYEDFHPESSGIIGYLKGFGFSVFYLDGSVIRPTLHEVDGERGISIRGADENFLAVRDAANTVKAYRRAGWRVFSL